MPKCDVRVHRPRRRLRLPKCARNRQPDGSRLGRPPGHPQFRKRTPHILRSQPVPAGCSLPTTSDGEAEEPMARTTVVGACPHDCPDTCSILTTVEDGKAVAVRGNPDHPFTRGRLCVKVNNYQERVYSEQRVLYPLRRVGPKGSGSFARMSWEEATSEIAARWKAIIAESGAEAILPYSYLGTQGIING